MTHALLIGAAVTVGALAWAAERLPNASFEEGDAAPAGWQLEGQGAWEQTGHSGKRSVSVTGNGEDSSFWRTTDYALKPNTLYRVSFWTTADRATSGCVITGASFCNRDFAAAPGWQRHSYVFITPGPDDLKDAYLRFGQWHVAGKVSFDDIDLRETQAVHERYGDVELGEGEEIARDTYRFDAPLSGDGAQFSRPLARFRCNFNSSRWVFFNGAEVAYRHDVAGRRQQSAEIVINCNYHASGSGFVEASADGKTWQSVARFSGMGSVKAKLPDGLFPAGAIFVRVRAAGKEADAEKSKPGDFQIDEYRYSAKLDADAGELIGATAYPQIEVPGEAINVKVASLPTTESGDAGRCKLSISNPGQADLALQAAATVTTENGDAESSVAAVDVKAGGQSEASVPCVLRRAGENTIVISLRSGGQELWRAKVIRRLAALHDATYGSLLPSDGACTLWWCEGTYKVSRTRPLPQRTANAVELFAARNEYESFQLVLRPAAKLTGLRVNAMDLKAADNTLGAKNVSVNRVGYVKVSRPTDPTGVRGWWPDPLPPLDGGEAFEAGANHPLWITVYVPADQPPGEYTGKLELSAEGWQASVPLRLAVWNLALPKEPHLQTGFGFDVNEVRRYHNLTTNDELRQVLDLYYRSFAAHRIAPYNPAPLDPFKVEFTTGPWDGGTRDAADPKQGTWCLKVVDDSETGSIDAHNTKLIEIDPAQRYRFSWWAKTAKPDQEYLVTLGQHDANGQWLSGNNIDLPRKGSGKWQQEEVSIPSPDIKAINPQTKLLKIVLRPAPWSEDGKATGTAWFDDIFLGLADGGPNLVEAPGFEQEAKELRAKIDFAAFDRECEKYLDGLGFNAVLIGLQGMGGGTFHSRVLGRIGGFAQGTREYDKLMASQGQQIVEHLRQKGWLRKAYMYWFDEPEPKDYPFVVEGMEIIKRSAPGLTRMLTEQPERELYGHVELWCPIADQLDAKLAAERIQKGERFWWYLCCGPHAPYIGLFIDHPAVDLRVWAWLSRKWGVSGQLVWQTNYWTSGAAFPDPDVQNPWDDPMSYVSGYSFKPGQIGYWGNGDGRFLYPPNRDIKNDRQKYLTGPVSSIRWEMLRDGIEDYEYFCLLDELVATAKQRGKAADLRAQAERLLVVPDAIAADAKTYSKDPRPLHEHRRKLGEMIERLAGEVR